MRTVKEFKDAGVVFVDGDKCKDDDYKYEKGWVTDKFQHFDECQVTELAWRDMATRPHEPKFKIELDIANHRWRPSLNQGGEWPDEQRINAIGQNGNDGLHYENTAQQFESLASDKQAKPVFTQAMADASELPPVGSFVLLNSDKEGEPEDLNLGDHCQVDCWERDSLLEVIAHTEISGVILPVVKFKNAVSSIMLNFIKPIPKTITVNGFEVPEPMREEPEHRQMVYLAHAAHFDFNLDFTWQRDNCAVNWLSRGLIHSTKESAIAHAKAMLGIDPNEQA